MELEFDRDVIQGYEVLADGTVCQEETLESIVPDACPDILRIVAVCGQAALNGKQARDFPWNCLPFMFSAFNCSPPKSLPRLTAPDPAGRGGF